ncbi:hypothetical protein [Cyclobacterium xiamenense]|uniref:hypothetical protein n=1 Tax=Cyclobacterium xiamenense TaxID=1297121 RepID=UPI0035D0F213
MRKIVVAYLLLSFLLGCQPDVSRDLQINQSFEGEEAYWVSKSLDEHLYLIFQPWEYFAQEPFLDTLPGCPEITRDPLTFSVSLDYDRPGCSDIAVERKGTVSIHYGGESTTVGDTLRLSFAGYKREGTELVGQRLFRVTEALPLRITLTELTDSLRLIHPQGSSTRLKPAYQHQGSLQSNRLVQIASQGQMQGRNWSGNDFEVVVDPQKLLSIACLSEPLPRAASGTESWTIFRAADNPVTHELVYAVTAACDSKTTIRLDEGVIMEKTP